MKPSSFKRLALIAAAALCLLAGGRLVERARRIGEAHNLYSRDAQGAVPPEYILASSLLGGFRSIFMTVLWMRAQELKETGRYYEMVDMYRIISRLQPSHSAAWRFQAWDLAYNVSSRFPESYDDRVFWVFRGLDLLRKEAIPDNRRSPELYWELAWFFHHKIGLDLDDAYPDYQRHLWVQVDGALQGTPPEEWHVYREIADARARFSSRRALLADDEVSGHLRRLRGLDPEVDILRDGARILAQPPETLRPLLGDPRLRATLRLAGLWAIGESMETELGMDAGEMHRLCERFGPINWRAPAAQSLYWATLGERIRGELRPDQPAARYQYLLFRSAINLPYMNQSPGLSDGGVFSIPDYRLVAPVMRFVEETLRRFETLSEAKRRRGELTINVELMRGFYLGFVSQIAMNAHLDGQQEVAARLLETLAEMTGDTGRYGDPERFTRQEMARTVAVLELDGTVDLLGSLYVQALQYLSLGDQKAYERQRQRVELLHSYASPRWRPDEGLAPLATIQRDIVARILAGRIHALDRPEQIEALGKRLRALEPAVLPR